MLKKVLDYLFCFKTFIFFNVLIFLLKTIYSFTTHFESKYFEDWRIANNVVKYATYSEFIEVGSTAYKLPIYPLFLSFFIKTFPNHSIEAVVISQHFIYFLIPLLIIKILEKFKNKNLAFLTAYFFTFSSAYFIYSNTIEATNVFIIITLIWLYFYIDIYLKLKLNYKTYFIFSFLTAMLFLTQVVVVPLASILICLLLIKQKIQFKTFLFVVFFSSLLYSPWVIRNYSVFDKFIISKTPVWQNIYVSFRGKGNVLKEVQLVSEKHMDYIDQKRLSTSEFEMEKMYKRDIIKLLNGKEHLFVVKMLQNAFLEWYVTEPYFYDTSIPILIRKVFVIILNILTICSLFVLFKNHRFLFYLTILVFLNFTFPYMIGHIHNTRFKLDFEYFQYFVVSYFILWYLEKRKWYTYPITMIFPTKF